MMGVLDARQIDTLRATATLAPDGFCDLLMWFAECELPFLADQNMTAM